MDEVRFEVVDDETAAAMRRLTPDQRIRAAHDLWQYVRERVEAAVRWQHPDWSEGEVRDEVNRRARDAAG